MAHQNGIVESQMEELRNDLASVVDAEEKRIETAYDTGCSDGYNAGFEDGLRTVDMTKHALERERAESYANGLNDAWDAVREINAMKPKDLERCFGQAGVSLDNIYSTPAADVINCVKAWRQKKNEKPHWIDRYNEEEKESYIECSVCGAKLSKELKWKFCPGCGSNMGEDE